MAWCRGMGERGGAVRTPLARITRCGVSIAAQALQRRWRGVPGREPRSWSEACSRWCQARGGLGPRSARRHRRSCWRFPNPIDSRWLPQFCSAQLLPPLLLTPQLLCLVLPPALPFLRSPSAQAQLGGGGQAGGPSGDLGIAHKGIGRSAKNDAAARYGPVVAGTYRALKYSSCIIFGIRLPGIRPINNRSPSINYILAVPWRSCTFAWRHRA